MRVITPPGYLDVRGIASYLDCSISTVYRLAKYEGLPLVKRIGQERGLIARKEEVEKWLVSRWASNGYVVRY